MMKAVFRLVVALGFGIALSGLAWAGNNPVNLDKLAPALREVANAAQMPQALGRLQAEGYVPWLSNELRPAPGQVRWNREGAVQVDVRFATPAALEATQASLRALGASGLLTDPYNTVAEMWLSPASLTQVASLPGVQAITVPHYAVVRREVAYGSNPPYYDTAGSNALGAVAFANATGDIGSGISVGVISDGAQDYQTDVQDGYLPSNVWIDPKDSTYGSSGNEGAAMMQIVYDSAPGVKLGFCGPSTDVQFLSCLGDFESTSFKANIIVDDLGFPGVAMFQNGTFATGVASFAQSNPSVHLVTAAGNDNGAFWEGTFTPMTLATPLTLNGVTYTEANNFGTAATPNPFAEVNLVGSDTDYWILEWADPWESPVGDYDVVVYTSPPTSKSSGTIVACNQGDLIDSTGCSFSTTPGTSPGPNPVQGNEYKNPTTNSELLYIEVLLRGGTSPSSSLKLLTGSANSNEITLKPGSPNGSIYGQSALPQEFTVGAMDVDQVGSSTGMIERYSSTGPVDFEYSSLTSTTPSPTSIPKPDITGVDGVTINPLGSFTSPFFGTSAAAPHIAALMALLLQHAPGTDPESTLDSVSSLPGGAPATGASSIYGAGVPCLAKLTAAGASACNPALTATITVGSSSSSSGSSSSSSGGGGGFGPFVLFLLAGFVLGGGWVGRRRKVIGCSTGGGPGNSTQLSE
jgi:hypothetical protein